MNKNMSTYLPILSILALGLALRIIGIDFGRPFRYHPDEVKLVWQAGNLLDVSSWSVETFFAIQVYPPFFTYVLAVAMGLYSAILLVLHGAIDFNLVRAWYYQDPFQYHLIARWISALAGTASIWLIYRIGKRLYGEKSGLLAALFLAVSFIHVRNSHFGVVDVPMTALMLLSFFFSVRILQGGGVRDYIGAAVFAALATATKWSAALIVLPLLLAHLTASISDRRLDLRRLFGKPIIFAALAGMIAFLIACPMPLLDFKEFWGGLVGGARFQQNAAPKLGAGGNFFSYFTGQHSPGYGFFYDNTLYQALGWGAVIAFVLGIVFLVWRRRRNDLLLLILPLVWYALMGQMQYKAMRQILPVVPFLLLISAEAILFLATRLQNKRKQVVVAIALSAGVVLPTGIKALRYDLALTRVDTRSQMKAWIEANLPADSRIGVEEFGPPLLSRWDLNVDILEHAPRHKKIFRVYGLVPGMFAHGKKRTALHNPADDVKREQLEYIVVDSFTYDRYHWPQTRRRKPELAEQRARFYEWLQQNTVSIYQIDAKDEFNISPSLELYKVNESIVDGSKSEKID